MASVPGAGDGTPVFDVFGRPLYDENFNEIRYSGPPPDGERLWKGADGCWYDFSGNWVLDANGNRDPSIQDFQLYEPSISPPTTERGGASQPAPQAPSPTLQSNQEHPPTTSAPLAGAGHSGASAQLAPGGNDISRFDEATYAFNTQPIWDSFQVADAATTNFEWRKTKQFVFDKVSDAKFGHLQHKYCTQEVDCKTADGATAKVCFAFGPLCREYRKSGKRNVPGSMTKEDCLGELKKEFDSEKEKGKKGVPETFEMCQFEKRVVEHAAPGRGGGAGAGASGAGDAGGDSTTVCYVPIWGPFLSNFKLKGGTPLIRGIKIHEKELTRASKAYLFFIENLDEEIIMNLARERFVDSMERSVASKGWKGWSGWCFAAYIRLEEAVPKRYHGVSSTASIPFRFRPSRIGICRLTHPTAHKYTSGLRWGALWEKFTSRSSRGNDASIAAKFHNSINQLRTLRCEATSSGGAASSSARQSTAEAAVAPLPDDGANQEHLMTDPANVGYIKLCPSGDNSYAQMLEAMPFVKKINELSTTSQRDRIVEKIRRWLPKYESVASVNASAADADDNAMLLRLFPQDGARSSDEVLYRDHVREQMLFHIMSDDAASSKEPTTPKDSMMQIGHWLLLKIKDVVENTGGKKPLNFHVLEWLFYEFKPEHEQESKQYKYIAGPGNKWKRDILDQLIDYLFDAAKDRADFDQIKKVALRAGAAVFIFHYSLVVFARRPDLCTEGPPLGNVSAVEGCVIVTASFRSERHLQAIQAWLKDNFAEAARFFRRWQVSYLALPSDDPKRHTILEVPPWIWNEALVEEARGRIKAESADSDVDMKDEPKAKRRRAISMAINDVVEAFKKWLVESDDDAPSLMKVRTYQLDDSFVGKQKRPLGLLGQDEPEAKRRRQISTRIEGFLMLLEEEIVKPFEAWLHNKESALHQALLYTNKELAESTAREYARHVKRVLINMMADEAPEDGMRTAEEAINELYKSLLDELDVGGQEHTTKHTTKMAFLTRQPHRLLDMLKNEQKRLRLRSLPPTPVPGEDHPSDDKNLNALHQLLPSVKTSGTLFINSIFRGNMVPRGDFSDRYRNLHSYRIPVINGTFHLRRDPQDGHLLLKVTSATGERPGLGEARKESSKEAFGERWVNLYSMNLGISRDDEIQKSSFEVQ